MGPHTVPTELSPQPFSSASLLPTSLQKQRQEESQKNTEELVSGCVDTLDLRTAYLARVNYGIAHLKEL